MQLHINPHDAAPVYRQIQHQIAQAIANREIRPGDLLDSQQELAVQMAVSPSAVRKAFQELQSDGFCIQAPGGHFQVTTPDLGSGLGSCADVALSLLKRELLTQELRTAREVQRRLLPPAEVGGELWTVSSRSYPAGALAGDFLDVVEHESGIVDLVIADVAGKGLAAGLIMAAAKSLIPLATSRSSPGEALATLNERLLPLLGQRDFVALAWARFDPGDGTLWIANAGLPDPYLLRQTGSVAALTVEGDHLPLGIRQGISYATAQMSLELGDRLLLVTDGIPEATGPDSDPIGYDGLSKLLETTTGPSFEWLDRLLDRLAHRTGIWLEDDWTAVLLDYHRPPRKTPCRS